MKFRCCVAYMMCLFMLPFFVGQSAQAREAIGIEVLELEVMVRDISKSGGVYLLQPLDVGIFQVEPKHIVLLKKQAKNVLAFRVLKVFYDLELFAAVKVKTYGQFRNARINSSFNAIRKVGNLFPALSKRQVKKAKIDLEELERSMDRAPASVGMSQEAHLKSNRSPFGLSAGLGSTYIQYKEGLNNVELNEFALTAKINANYRLSSKFDLGANAFINFLPTGSKTNATNLARFYGVNGRVGFLLP